LCVGKPAFRESTAYDFKFYVGSRSEYVAIPAGSQAEFLSRHRDNWLHVQTLWLSVAAVSSLACSL